MSEPAVYKADRSPAPVEVRFWRHVRKTETCWVWIARSRTEEGYGRFAVRRGEPWIASRYSWVLHHGPIPDGLFVLHHCDNRLCVRPDHLFVGTQRDNMQDAIAKGRVRPTGAIGERNSHARLTEVQVKEIRQRYAGGEGVVALSRVFGVHRETVGRILRGIRWTQTTI